MFNPSGSTSVSVDLEGPDHSIGLDARLFRAFPAREQL